MEKQNAGFSKFLQNRARTAGKQYKMLDFNRKCIENLIRARCARALRARERKLFFFLMKTHWGAVEAPFSLLFYLFLALYRSVAKTLGPLLQFSNSKAKRIEILLEWSWNNRKRKRNWKRKKWKRKTLDFGNSYRTEQEQQENF